MAKPIEFEKDGQRFRLALVHWMSEACPPGWDSVVWDWTTPEDLRAAGFTRFDANKPVGAPHE
jgi:hypothetical protein